MNKFVVIFLISLFIIIIGCKNKDTGNKTTISISDFNLKKDITDFSKKMTKYDTIYVFADLSVDMTRAKYCNILTKSNDTVYIATKAVDKTETMNELVIDFGKTVYNNKLNDSLNLEDLIYYMQKYACSEEYLSFPTLQIIYKADTISYKLSGILDILEFTRYYISIIQRHYPNMEKYPGIVVITEGGGNASN
jgi:hypothetical protein